MISRHAAYRLSSPREDKPERTRLVGDGRGQCGRLPAPIVLARHGCLSRNRLDADARIDVVLKVAGVGVVVVGRAAVELIPLANLMAYDQSDGYSSEPSRYPADSFEQGGFLTERQWECHRSGFRLSAEETALARGPHGKDDSAGRARFAAAFEVIRPCTSLYRQLFQKR